MTDEDRTPQEIRAQLEERLRIYDGLARALAEPVRFLELMLAAPEPDEARVVLMRELGLDELQATAAMDLQVRLFTVRDRARVEEERASLRHQLEQLP